MKHSPRLFRQSLVLPNESRTPFRHVVQPWQAKDFASLDPAWKQLASSSQPGKNRLVRNAWIERPRGHSKTSDTAMQLGWILSFASRCVSGLAAAADKDQANLICRTLQSLAEANGELFSPLVFQKHRIFHQETGSTLEVISSDVSSSWGQLPDFIICDELCHWEKPELWYSLFSSAAKKPDCVLIVLTNAGVGTGWQWSVRESARQSDQWYFSSIEGCQAPWIDQTDLLEQQQLLPPAVFNRLWMNRWQHSDGEFVSLKEAEACCDISLREQSQGHPGWQYVAAVDYAEKHDYTVGVVLHQEENRIVVDRMDVVVPDELHPTKVQWVEDWLERIHHHFQPQSFVLDEYQLLGTIQKLEARLPIERFDFQVGQGNHALALTLRRLILHQEIAWYPACGQLAHLNVRDDLETELASLLLKQKASGRLRIDHHRDNQHHDDRAFTLGAACLYLIKQNRNADWITFTNPEQSGLLD